MKWIKYKNEFISIIFFNRLGFNLILLRFDLGFSSVVVWVGLNLAVVAGIGVIWIIRELI